MRWFSPRRKKILVFLIVVLVSFNFLTLAGTEQETKKPVHFSKALPPVYYNRSAAVGYAYRWYNLRNPHYQDFTSSGGDCANFVSQCLIAGGLSLHNGTNGVGYGVYPDSDRPTLYSNGTIPYCDYLHLNLINYQPVKYAYVTTANATIPSWMEIGDVVIFGNSTDPWQHAMLVVWRNATDLGLAAHTTDVWNVSFWTELSYFGRANFYHIISTGYNNTEFVFEVRVSTLNVRVGPGTNDLGTLYQDIGDIHRGERYVAFQTIVDSSGNVWYHFWYDDRAAWCAAVYGGNVYAEPVGINRYLEVHVSRYLNVRTGPGTSYTDIGEVYPGMRFYPIYVFNGTSGKWVEYFWEGRKVWSYEPYVYLGNYTLPAKNLTRVFFGFYPYWLGTNHSFIQWDKISHIAWFSISLNSDGTVANYNGWPATWNSLVTDAHINSTKVLITAILFGSTSIDTLLRNSTYRATAVNNLVNAVLSGYADGVCIDFETPPSGDGYYLSLFMRELKENLTSQNPDYSLALCLSPYPWSTQVWGDAELFNVLNSYVDYYFLMGYDYYWSGSSNTGACGALFSPNGVDAYDAILKYLSYGANRTRFIYGVPYYGYDWPVSSTSYSTPGTATTGTGSSRTYSSAMYYLSAYGATLQWNTTFKSPWFWYYNGTAYRQIWFDNATSIGYKYELVNRLDLAGAGTWALGYDKGTTALWDMIARKLGNFSIDILYPSPSSIIGGTINGTVIVKGGVHSLRYRVNGGNWQNSSPRINLHDEWKYFGGIAYRAYVQIWNFYINTNTMLPGYITLEFEANNSLGFTKTWNITYYVQRNVALNGSAFGSSDAYALNDDIDYVDPYSGYASNDLGKPLYLVLPRNYTIKGFKFHLWDGDSRYYQYKISVSRDNKTWVEIVNRTNGTWRGWQWISFTPGSVLCKYIKINVTYNSANQWYHIIEFKVFTYDDPVLAGFVKDNTGVPLANVTLTIKNTRTGEYVNAMTDSHGYYEVSLTGINATQGDLINVSISSSGYYGYGAITTNLLNPAPTLNITATPQPVPELNGTIALISLMLFIAFVFKKREKGDRRAIRP